MRDLASIEPMTYRKIRVKKNVTWFFVLTKSRVNEIKDTNIATFRYSDENE